MAIENGARMAIDELNTKGIAIGGRKLRWALPVETHAPYAYDAVMVFAATMQKAQSSDPARFLPVLAGIRHLGVTGTIAFDPHGDLRDAAMTLYTYRQGKKVKLLVVRAK